jgi:glycosyltransferase involved in cell wall biosynthesis
MPAVSVIVTSYNIERYLGECLDSLLAQTLQDLEIIVVDDGSTDSSPEIVKRYAARDPRIRPVLLPDNSPGAVGTPSNAGLELATAPYVGFADGDDVLAPTMFEELHRAAVTHDTDLVMCQYEELVEPTGERRAPADAKRWEQLEPGRLDLDVATRKQILRFVAVPWRKLYRRDLLERHQIRFPVGDHYYEDNPFHWFSVVSADSIAIVPQVLCAHRVNRPGQTMAAHDARLRAMVQ